jgi:hypothetical protein
MSSEMHTSGTTNWCIWRHTSPHTVRADWVWDSRNSPICCRPTELFRIHTTENLRPRPHLSGWGGFKLFASVRVHLHAAPAICGTSSRPRHLGSIITTSAARSSARRTPADSVIGDDCCAGLTTPCVSTSDHGSVDDSESDSSLCSEAVGWGDGAVTDCDGIRS